MATTGKSRSSTEHLSQGLDRATYNVYANPERHLIAPLQPDALNEESSTGLHRLKDVVGFDGSAKDKLRHISKKVSENVKTTADIVLHPTNHKKEKSTDPTTVPTLAPPPIEDAENDRLFHDAPEQKGPDFKEVVKHPVSTVQSTLHGASGAKFAETMDNQVIAHGAEVRLVRAYDEVVNATSEEDKTNAADHLEELKKTRQDSYVRWTLDRHVLMVRRVPPRTTAWPKFQDFKPQTKDSRAHTQWADYGHHLLRYCLEHYGDQYIDQNPNLPNPSEEALNTTVERLIMTSTPYQMLLMRIRSIYRWDDPIVTAQYLTAYIFCWVMNYISGAAILSLIYVVVKRGFYPPTLEDVRKEIKRSEDVEMTAMNLTQLIEQHGSHGWTDALRQDLGPWLLLQIEDLGNVLEIWRKSVHNSFTHCYPLVLQSLFQHHQIVYDGDRALIYEAAPFSFYEWREPTRTKITLVLLTFLWLAITFIPLHILIKVAQFNFGVLFFGLFPLATRYPQYRLLASPMKWLFWRVPTDAEWAIARLQLEASHRTAAMQKAGLESNDDHHIEEEKEDDCSKEVEERDPTGTEGGEKKDIYIANLGKYHCTSRSHHGDLCINSIGVKYVSAIRKNLLWELRFDETRLIQKVGAGEGLLFVHSEGEEFRVSGLKMRNEVFTQILGYSGLKWQVSG
ncbi:MAG: hypothetical protein Q9186_001427 [Xanthomendoza sp. 1 TL-2023]